MENTKVEWPHHTFNPVIGCYKKSRGCQHCYAEVLNRHWKWAVWGKQGTLHEVSEAYWKRPLLWNKKAQRAGERHRVFCASMADVFDPRWPPAIRDRLFQLIRDTPHLDWMLLTKEPLYALRWLDYQTHAGTIHDFAKEFPNVWYGVSIEDQETAMERLPLLRLFPARIRFISCEPLLESIPFGRLFHSPSGVANLKLDGIDWIVIGGESGTDATPMHSLWPQQPFVAARLAGVKVFFKQWGEYRPHLQVGPGFKYCAGVLLLDGRLIPRKSIDFDLGHFELATQDLFNMRTAISRRLSEIVDEPADGFWDRFSPELIYKLGKSKAGAEFNGGLLKEFPEVQEPSKVVSIQRQKWG